MAELYYFGRLADVAGAARETVALPPSIRDTTALRAWLDESRGWDGALTHRSVKVAVNDEIVSGDAGVTDADEIAFLPPVGGG